MIIRKAKRGELKEVARIFHIGSSKPPYNKKRKFSKTLEIVKEDSKAQDIYVAVVDGKIAGFVMVSRDSGLKNQLWVNELWILEEYKGKGIGKAIMKKIEEIYRKRGIHFLELVSHTGKGGAVGFYKKIGYHEDKNMVFMRIRTWFS